MGVKTLNTDLVNIPTDSKMTVYPNPSNGVINILKLNDAKRIEVYDLQGRSLYKSNFSKKIDLSFLSKGIYIIKTDLNQTAKFVIN
jgi:hypothetical protein